MAFLCPSRVGKKTKKKRELLKGRITGSDSIDTMVRVGLEKEKALDPESRMIILHDFRSFSKGELGVTQGQYVFMLYRENDWAYVITMDGKEGFVPYTYCAKQHPRPYNKHEKEIKKHHGGETTKQTTLNQILSENLNFDNESSFGTKELSEQSATFLRLVSTSSKSVHPFVHEEVLPFRKRFQGEYLVLYDFKAIGVNDLGARAGELVSLLNSEDPLWYWVKNKRGDEGFVPAEYVCNIDRLRQQEAAIAACQGKLRHKDNAKIDPSHLTLDTEYWSGHCPIPCHEKHDTDWKTIPSCTNVNSQTRSHPPRSGVKTKITTELNSAPTYDNFQRHQLYFAERGSKSEVCEYVCLHDYVAQAQDDLTVAKGDLVFVIKEDQNNEDWYWCYSRKSQRYGYIPKSYLKTAMKSFF
ncbi:hypothetical protein ACJMK2_029989 [Sinanodonta woodiana]|uniref:SH3 domain-containing protein n=1 Tax=Sinanodonta woodiana TaxID=1069815 RepID=A0ABD3XBW4_SINWO